MVRKRACDSCRSKKIQCDEGKPRCEWCTHRGLDCTFNRPAPRPSIKKMKKDTLKGQMNQRLARLESLLGVEAYQKALVQRIEAPRPPPDALMVPRRGLYYSPAMHFAGFNITDAVAQIGIPIFCKFGMAWIQDKSGASALFEDIYAGGSFAGLSLQDGDDFRKQGGRMPSRSAAFACLELFSKSPKRRVFPIVDVDSFGETIQLAYDSAPGRKSEQAQTCVLAFVATVKVLEPKAAPASLGDTETFLKKAQVALSMQLDQLTVETLQTALMLCMCHDFSGSIKEAAVALSTAVQCVYGLGAHLGEDEIPAHLGEGESRGAGAYAHLRKLFWLCYFFDKHIALRTGRPMLLRDDECDLTTKDNIDAAFTQERQLPLYPADPELTKLKSRVSTVLYSKAADLKTDLQMIQDIRVLDDELEEWRLSMPRRLRPRLVITDITPATGLEEEEDSTYMVFTNLEYLYLVATIHRACGRCAYVQDGVDASPTINSSMMLSVHASRATLVYLSAAAKHVHDEFFWLTLLYPVWATTTMFTYLLQFPLADTVSADLALLSSVPQMFKDMRSRDPTTAEARHLLLLDELMKELIRLSKSAIAKAEAAARQGALPQIMPEAIKCIVSPGGV